MGKARPVRVITDADLKENGGRFVLQGGAVRPVYGLSATTLDRSVEGGAASAIYVVSEEDITSGRFALLGGAPLYVTDAADGRPVMGGPAMPVYVVNSGWPTPTLSAPVNTVLPVISGTTTLSCTTGTWTNSPTEYAYQWERNGVAIDGATSNTYTPVSADGGADLTCTVTASNAVGSTAATSAALTWYDPAASALFARMDVQPDATRKAAIDTLILALKSAGVWDELDELWVYAAHTSQAALLGWKGYKNCLAVNSPTFTQDRGFAGNGTTSYLNTQFVPSTDGVNYGLNDASFGVYSRTNSISGVTGGGGSSTETRRSGINARNASDLFRADINMNGSELAAVASTDAKGFFVSHRAASDTMTGWKNGTQVSTANVSSAGLPPVELHIGAFSNGGSATSFSVRQHAAAFVGAAMTEQQQADFYTAIQAYMTAVGAAV